MLNTKWYGDAKAICDIENNSEHILMIDERTKEYIICPKYIYYKDCLEFCGNVFVSNCERIGVNNDFIRTNEMCRYSFVFNKDDFYASNNEPPLGIIPHNIWVEKRIEELSSAINRYIAANMKISIKWIEEYNKLIGE